MVDPEIRNNLKDRDFRKHLSQYHPDLLLVKEIANTMKFVIAKPQKLLLDTDDYYVAVDLSLNTYYICYKDLLMLDLDSYKDDIDLEDCLPHCLCQVVPHDKEITDPTQKRQHLWKQRVCKDGKDCQLRYRIFKSRKGYHAFVVSHKFDPKTEHAVGLMAESSTDFFYIIFSYLRGWSVRLNRKPGEKSEDDLYTYTFDWFLGKSYDMEFDMGSGQIIDNCPGIVLKDLSDLIDVHIKLCDSFRSAPECITFNL